MSFFSSPTLSFLKTPKKSLSYLLITEAKVSYDEHVWVVPMSRPSVGNDCVLVVSVVVDDACHGLPAVLNVVEISPDVAGAGDRGVIRLQTKERSIIAFCWV